MQLIPAADLDADQLDALVALSPMATFLHTRRFLSYHGSRFRDVSLAIVDELQHVLGLLPAAVDPGDERRIVSHPGLTYGGIVHDGRLRGERMIEALEAVRRHYAQQGFAAFRYKAVPAIYHRAPADDDLYALFRLGARRLRCDLSSTIDLAERRPPSERRRRSLKKARKAGLEIRQGAEFIPMLWAALEENLASRHGASPVHTAAEIARLHQLFPGEIAFVVALRDDKVEAGVVLFLTPRVSHAQYIASTSTGYQLSALDAVFEHCIAEAQARGARYFDFGTSNEQEGRTLNEGLYQFKTEFGGGGVAYETYELDLRA
jgi:hypothetical protein